MRGAAVVYWYDGLCVDNGRGVLLLFTVFDHSCLTTDAVSHISRHICYSRDFGDLVAQISRSCSLCYERLLCVYLIWLVEVYADILRCEIVKAVVSPPPVRHTWHLPQMTAKLTRAWRRADCGDLRRG